MAPEDLVLLIVSKGKDGRIQGKTLLQKRAYFLEQLLGLDLGFRAHFYGPYSPMIDNALAKTKALGFIEERRQGFGALDPVGFEVRRYDYELTEDGQAVEEFLTKDEDVDSRVVQALRQMAKAGDTGDYVSLSIAAKTHFVLSSKNRRMKTGQIREAAKKLGWNISEDAIEDATSFLKKLGLVD